MNYFRSAGLQDPAHDVDGSIMAVEQGCSGNDPDRM
jgi:hypothetical protein